MNVEMIISALRNSDRYIESIYSQGGCYQFYKFLKALCPQGVPLINIKKDHIITEIDGYYYDIIGLVDGDGFIPMTFADVEEAKTWSFSRSMAMSIGECQHCEEPILI